MAMVLRVKVASSAPPGGIKEVNHRRFHVLKTPVSFLGLRALGELRVFPWGGNIGDALSDRLNDRWGGRPQRHQCARQVAAIPSQAVAITVPQIGDCQACEETPH